MLFSFLPHSFQIAPFVLKNLYLFAHTEDYLEALLKIILLNILPLHIFSQEDLIKSRTQ